VPRLHVQALIEGLAFRHFGGVVGSGRGGLLGREQLGAKNVDECAPGPCAECPNAARCGSQRLACEQFSMFIRFGGDVRWRPAPRVPSKHIFEILFPEAAQF
jgi:hypothetical protein